MAAVLYVVAIAFMCCHVKGSSNKENIKGFPDDPTTLFAPSYLTESSSRLLKLDELIGKEWFMPPTAKKINLSMQETGFEIMFTDKDSQGNYGGAGGEDLLEFSSDMFDVVKEADTYTIFRKYYWSNGMKVYQSIMFFLQAPDAEVNGKNIQIYFIIQLYSDMHFDIDVCSNSNNLYPMSEEMKNKLVAAARNFKDNGFEGIAKENLNFRNVEI